MPPMLLCFQGVLHLLAHPLRYGLVVLLLHVRLALLPPPHAIGVSAIRDHGQGMSFSYDLAEVLFDK